MRRSRSGRLPSRILAFLSFLSRNIRHRHRRARQLQERLRIVSQSHGADSMERLTQTRFSLLHRRNPVGTAQTLRLQLRTERCALHIRGTELIDAKHEPLGIRTAQLVPSREIRDPVQQRAIDAALTLGTHEPAKPDANRQKNDGATEQHSQSRGISH